MCEGSFSPVWMQRTNASISSWKWGLDLNLGLNSQSEPQEVVYRLDYNPEARAHREDYVQMFRDCGWEYVQDYVGYSYFRKPAPASERDAEIFCDDASRLEMMERVLKGRMLPLVAILLLVIVPVLIVEGQRTEPFSRFVTVVYLLILAVYIAVFLKFGIQFWKRMNAK